MSEFWLPLPPPFEGYAVSTEGRIKSMRREVYYAPYVTRDGTSRAGYTRVMPPTILQPWAKPSGHLQVVPGRKNGSHDVHVLVALGFLGPRPEGLDTRHRNGVPSDNRPENLCYGTRTQNTLDDWDHGKKRQGWKLYPWQVRRIRKRRQAGEKLMQLAQRYNVAVVTISLICTGRNRKHVK